MKNYANLIAFNQDVDRNKLKEILNNNGIDFEEVTCYEAAIREEVSQTLVANNIIVNEDNMQKVISDLENEDNLWESLEDAVSEAINDTPFEKEED